MATGSQRRRVDDAQLDAEQRAGRPWPQVGQLVLGCADELGLVMPTVATGLVSVMPQACMIGMPICSRYPSDSDRGTADPPQGWRAAREASRPSSSGSTPIQIVGTPAATVTFSLYDEVGQRLGRQVRAGHDSVAPVATAGVGEAPGVGVEHRDDRQDAVGLPDADAVGDHAPPWCAGTIERWEYTTPLGLPVVPLV